MPNAELKFFAKRRKVSAFSLQPSAFAGSAFTLAELLVVISILGILAALTVPALKNLGKSNAAISASRQMLQAVGYARQLAIANHSEVYMVFVPTNFWNSRTFTPYYTTGLNNLTPAQLAVATNLCGKQLTGYTFIAWGAAGDQPGQRTWHYLAPWQSLPDGAFIASWKFNNDWSPSPPMVIDDPVSGQVLFNIYRFNYRPFPFPTEDAWLAFLPFIAFNSFGQLIDTSDRDNPAKLHEYIPLARGSVVPAMDPSTKAFQFNPPSVSEMPPGNSTNSAYNLVDIDPLTGRAALEFQKAR